MVEVSFVSTFRLHLNRVYVNVIAVSWFIMWYFTLFSTKKSVCKRDCKGHYSERYCNKSYILIITNKQTKPKYIIIQRNIFLKRLR